MGRRKGRPTRLIRVDDEFCDLLDRMKEELDLDSRTEVTTHLVLNNGKKKKERGIFEDII